VLGDVDVVLLPEPLDESVSTVECLVPVDCRLIVAVLDCLERILLRCSSALADSEEVFARDTADVHARPADWEPCIHYRRRESSSTRFRDGSKGSGPTAENHEIIRTVILHLVISLEREVIVLWSPKL